MMRTSRAEKQGIIHLIILLSAALCIGVYLIVTTVLIAKDGVFYIKQAQAFSNNPVSVIKDHPLGYPFLIFLSHRAATLFSHTNSLYSWIYSAQCMSLLTRILSLIPLYFIGKKLVGARRSFWALLILIMLPYPAEFGSDVVRDWPHILFLSTGFLFLIYGSISGKWWMFAVAGLITGLGHTIRPECAQIIVCGILWLLIRLIFPRYNISRLKAVCLVLILLIAFAIPAAPYIKARGQLLPPTLKRLIICNAPSQSSGFEQNYRTAVLCTASEIPTEILKALGKLAQEISDNLMYFFVLPLLLGLYYHFRRLRKILITERFFILALIVLYSVMIVFLHISHIYVSRRHCMPIVVFTVFYIPVGMQILAHLLSKWASRNTLIVKKNRKRWFFILIGIGFIICATKFVRITPLRWQKQGYLDAAKWLNNNTAATDIVAVPDMRIAFYAERKGLEYDKKIPSQTGYVVKVHKDEKTKTEEELMQKFKVFSVPSDDNKPAIAIYDLRRYISECVSFVDYFCEKLNDKKYRLSLIFDVHKKFEKNWRIYLHGEVKAEHVAMLPENLQKFKFANWDFKPQPTTSLWNPNERITIIREISAKPIPYRIKLGFNRPGQGRHGRQIDLGWIDLGSIQYLKNNK